MKKPRRSMLFIPGSNAAMLSTAFVYRPDSILFDLEDAVALREKDSARLLVFHALQLPVYKEMEIVVRINPLDSPFGLKDLEAAVRGGAAIIRLPKTERASDMLDLEREVGRIERECGREPGSTRLMAAIESASGIVNALAIATASPRMDSIALAGFDYVVDMQTQRGDGIELFYARCAVLHAARAARIDAFDVVFSDVNDDEGFLKEVQLIKRLGFNGKSLINPRQIELLHTAFEPTEEEVLKAERIVEAAEKAEREGLGVVSLNGRMVDAPVVRNARRILQLAGSPPART
jgi:citrate lyase subunit beta/citryl-CoA lyase